MKKVLVGTVVLCFILMSGVIKAQTGNALPAVDKGDKGVISLKEMAHDFGEIKEEAGPVTYKFDFTNTGKQPLLLSNVQASCGCTTPDWTKEPIAPGKKGFVSATYNPQNRPGKFTKNITITSNASEPTIVLTISGEVIPKPVTPVETPEKKK